MSVRMGGWMNATCLRRYDFCATAIITKSALSTNMNRDDRLGLSGLVSVRTRNRARSYRLSPTIRSQYRSASLRRNVLEEV